MQKLLKNWDRWLLTKIVFSILYWFCLVFFTLVTILYSLPFFLFNKNSNILRRLSYPWGKALLSITFTRINVLNGYNQLNVNENYIFMCNHKSYFDIYILFVVLKDFDFVFLVKKELFKIPFFGWALKKLGYIPIDRGNTKQAVKNFIDVVNIIKRGRSVAIFPEGTRSVDGKLLPLKRGPFTIAERTKLKIVPVKIGDTHLVNRRGKFLITPFKKIDVKVYPPIETIGKSTDELIGIVRKCLI